MSNVDYALYYRKRSIEALLRKMLFDVVDDPGVLRQDRQKAIDEASDALARMFDAQHDFTLAQAERLRVLLNEMEYAEAQAARRKTI